MQIVINIPKEIYDESQHINDKYEEVIQMPLEVIKNGTPLDYIKEEIIEGKYTIISRKRVSE